MCSQAIYLYYSTHTTCCSTYPQRHITQLFFLFSTLQLCQPFSMCQAPSSLRAFTPAPPLPRPSSLLTKITPIQALSLLCHFPYYSFTKTCLFPAIYLSQLWLTVKSVSWVNDNLQKKDLLSLFNFYFLHKLYF